MQCNFFAWLSEGDTGKYCLRKASQPECIIDCPTLTPNCQFSTANWWLHEASYCVQCAAYQHSAFGSEFVTSHYMLHYNDEDISIVTVLVKF